MGNAAYPYYGFHWPDSGGPHLQPGALRLPSAKQSEAQLTAKYTEHPQFRFRSLRALIHSIFAQISSA